MSMVIGIVIHYTKFVFRRTKILQSFSSSTNRLSAFGLEIQWHIYVETIISIKSIWISIMAC